MPLEVDDDSWVGIPTDVEVGSGGGWAVAVVIEWEARFLEFGDCEDEEGPE